jgi:hypothetical protein
MTLDQYRYYRTHADQLLQDLLEATDCPEKFHALKAELEQVNIILSNLSK